ncbi:hypothetical protein ACSZMC_10495 [Aeromonas jandaei]|uniref:hypothetical protein n=1 Tax=Aeromonas jandaei TaxID=650 RepID=UPI003EC8D25D
MNAKLAMLKESLENLSKAISQKDLPDQTFDTSYGWNSFHIAPVDILNTISNIITKLNSYSEPEIPNGLYSTIDELVENINKQAANVTSYLANDAGRVSIIIPSILFLLQVIDNEIETELFSWASIQSNKLVPKNLKNRLRALNSQLDSLESGCGNIDGKVKAINNAYDTAESLPAVIQDLNDAKEKLASTINETRDEINKYKNEINAIKDNITIAKSKSIAMHDDIKERLLEAENCAERASSLVNQCDDALQITTTQGLAAGFDQKAKELQKSIWVWIAGLLIALAFGIGIGSSRVADFTEALKGDLTAGQAILHTIISIFSIGGPLWLAWISTQQINQRFKLSEDYSYKATVAKAFTGFRKISEDFNQETSERLFNSTLDRFDEMPLRLVSGKDYNSPWHEFIDSEAFKKAIDMVPALAKEAGRFAENTKLNKNIPVPKSDEKPVKVKQEEKATAETE